VYQQQEELSSANSKTILAIDDDPHILGLYERYLQPKGYQVIGLSDPSKAFEKARQIKPAVITLDILMPGYDGWQVLSEIKSHAETSSIPVIICSILDEEEKGFNLGATDYLIKPINDDELITAIQRLNKDGRIREVLVIDDDPNDLRLIGKMLSNQGKFKPILVEGGPAGWKAITTSTPHIILLDLFMPELNGFAILEKLKQDKTLHDIPVIVISNADLTQDQESQLEEFSERILHKGSFKENDLILTIENTLKQAQFGTPTWQNVHLISGNIMSYYQSYTPIQVSAWEKEEHP
jgi:CheY-like chemotaxis protein